MEHGADLSFLTLFNFVIWELPDVKYQTLKEMKQSDLLEYCIPKGASGEQLRDVVADYLVKHPETRHLSGAALTQRALSEAFECETPSVLE